MSKFFNKQLQELDGTSVSLYTIGYDKIAVVGEGNEVLNRIPYTKFPEDSLNVFGFMIVFVKYGKVAPNVSQYTEIYYYD